MGKQVFSNQRIKLLVLLQTRLKSTITRHRKRRIYRWSVNKHFAFKFGHRQSSGVLMQLRTGASVGKHP